MGVPQFLSILTPMQTMEKKNQWICISLLVHERAENPTPVF